MAFKGKSIFEIAVLLAASMLVPAASAKVFPAHIVAAVKVSGRPPADVQADDYRKPARIRHLFARVKRGDNVLELLGMVVTTPGCLVKS